MNIKKLGGSFNPASVLLSMASIGIAIAAKLVDDRKQRDMIEAAVEKHFEGVTEEGMVVCEGEAEPIEE